MPAPVRMKAAEPSRPHTSSSLPSTPSDTASALRRHRGGGGKVAPQSPAPGGGSSSQKGTPRAAPGAGTKAGASRPAGQQKHNAAAMRQQFPAVLTSILESELVCNESLSKPAQGGKKGVRFRGVTRHKRTQRFEAHIWESKKQIYLGGFDSEVLAAKSHDVMALRCKDTAAEVLNFCKEEYTRLLPYMEVVSREDVIAALRTYSKTHSSLHPARTPSTAASIHQTAKGRVQKVSAPSKPASPPASPRKLSINTAPSFEALSVHSGAGSAQQPPSSGPRLPSSPKRSMRASQLSAPATPKADSHERPAPVTPTHPTTHVVLCAGAEGSERLASPFGSPFQQRALHHVESRALHEHMAGAGAELVDDMECDEGDKCAGFGGFRGFDSDGSTTDCDSEEEEEELQQVPVRGGGRARRQGLRLRVPGGAARQEVVGAERLLSDSSLLLLPEEPSLTFSADEVSRLYEWTAVDSAHSGLEHTLTGTVLFRSPEQEEEHRRAAAEAALSCQLEACTSGTLGQVMRQDTSLLLLALEDLDPLLGRPPSEIDVAVQPSSPSASWPNRASIFSWAL